MLRCCEIYELSPREPSSGCQPRKARTCACACELLEEECTSAIKSYNIGRASYASPRKTIHCSVQSTSASGVVCWKWSTSASSSFGGHVLCPAKAERNSWALSIRKRDSSPKTKFECGCGINNDLECQKQSTLIVTLNEVGDSVLERTEVRE